MSEKWCHVCPFSIGVAGYELTRKLPDRLKEALPDPKELEEKILFELGIDEQEF